MGKRTYSERDRAAVYVALQINDGNVLRSSRETGVPEQTVREWKKKFETDPPDLETTEAAASDFVEKAEEVRDLLLSEYLKALKAGKINPDKMPIHIGIFTDKVNLLKGLATSRREDVVGLPNAEQVRELAAGVFDAMRFALDSAKEREQDIIDVEFTEVENNPTLELSPPKE